MITCIITDFEGRAWRRREFATWHEALEWSYFGSKLKGLVGGVREAFA